MSKEHLHLHMYCKLTDSESLGSKPMRLSDQVKADLLERLTKATFQAVRSRAKSGQFFETKDSEPSGFYYVSDGASHHELLPTILVETPFKDISPNLVGGTIVSTSRAYPSPYRSEGMHLLGSIKIEEESSAPVVMGVKDTALRSFLEEQFYKSFTNSKTMRAAFSKIADTVRASYETSRYLAERPDQLEWLRDFSQRMDEAVEGSDRSFEVGQGEFMRIFAEFAALITRDHRHDQGNRGVGVPESDPEGVVCQD